MVYKWGFNKHNDGILFFSDRKFFTNYNRNRICGFFLGKVGIVKQYNIALTQDEITTTFNATRTRYGL